VDFILWWFILWFILAVLVGLFWTAKGRSFVGGFFLALVLSPFVGFVVGLVISNKREEKFLSAVGMKKCPYCGDPVLRDAIRCRHCRSDFPPPESRPESFLSGDHFWEDLKKFKP